MKKRNSRLVTSAWVVLVLALVTSMVVASFFLTGSLYRLAGWEPAPLLAQIINSLLSLLFTGLFIGGVSHVARSRGWLPEMHLFAQLIEAMQRIAKGDFSVRLDDTFPDNEPVGVLVKSVNDMALELNTMETMRQEFISNVSHELQSPLTSIRGFAQALENDQLTPAERQHYLAIIKSESTRMSRITENLLKIAALDSRQLALKPETYRLDRQIRSLVLASEPQWAAKQLEIELCLEELAIVADEDLLSQVWSNLLHNSVKFTPPGGSVRLSLRQGAGQAVFEIADSGIGIAEQNLARVFERFFKADASRTRANSGSGLGLAITKKIVELHGGTIGVVSAPGAGAHFTVALPLSLGAAPQIPESSGRSAPDPMLQGRCAPGPPLSGNRAGSP